MPYAQTAQYNSIKTFLLRSKSIGVLSGRAYAIRRYDTSYIPAFFLHKTVVDGDN